MFDSELRVFWHQKKQKPARKHRNRSKWMSWRGVGVGQLSFKNLLGRQSLSPQNILVLFHVCMECVCVRMYAVISDWGWGQTLLMLFGRRLSLGEREKDFSNSVFLRIYWR